MLLLLLLRRARAWARPHTRPLLGGVLGLGLGLLLAAQLWRGFAQGPAQDRVLTQQALDQRADAARQARAHRTDSAAAFTAGRLYEQRIAQAQLRRQDETHDSTRRAGGLIRLPAFPGPRP